MGAIECQVKVLSGKEPLLFAWENPTKGSVECVLVTCQCQTLDLDKMDSLSPWKPEAIWVPSLVKALEKSEIYSFNSVDPCDSLANHIKVAGDIPFCPTTKADLEGLPKKLRKKYAEKLRRAKKNKSAIAKTKNKQTDVNNPASESEVGDIAEPEVGDIAGSDLEGTQGNTETLLADPDIDASNKLTASHGNSKYGVEGLPAEEEDCSEGDMQPADVPNEICAFDVMTGNRVVTVENTDTCSSTAESAEIIMTDLANKSDLAENGDTNTTGGVGNLPASSNLVQAAPDHLEGPVIASNHGATELVIEVNSLDHGSIDIVPLESIQVIPSNLQEVQAPPVSTSLSGDSALMKAIDSIMGMTPTSGESFVSQLISEQTFSETVPSQQQPQFVTKPQDPHAPATNVEFIRPLTEDERQKMFSFKEDRDRKNLQGLTESGTKVFLCEHCGKVLSVHTRKKHMETHQAEREREHICERCGKGFFTAWSLKNHVRIHDPSREGFQCRYCTKSYKTVFGRTVHERLHFGVYHSTCEKCGRKFSDNRVGRNHSEICRGPGTRKLQRARRERTHLQPGDYNTVQCPFCKKVLRKASYRAHIDMHENKMFTCPICAKVMRFSTRTSHMHIHNSTKDFPCQYCAKPFRTKQAKQVHERVHTGEKPHKCRYCERTFGRYSSREVHESTHTNLRPYKCQICDKTWKDRSSYWLHMKKNHPGEPLSYKRLSSQINSKQGHQFLIDSAETTPIATTEGQQWQPL